jgi:hypothetical protein
MDICVFTVAYLNNGPHYAVSVGDDTFHETSANDAAKRVKEVIRHSTDSTEIHFAPKCDVWIPYGGGPPCLCLPLTEKDKYNFWSELAT